MALFLDKGLLHPDFARKLMSWKHSGFSVARGTRIDDKEVHFSCLHIPPRGRHLRRYYGLYSSRARGTWRRCPAFNSRAPEHWYGRSADNQNPDATTTPPDREVGQTERRSAWARLFAKVYEVDIWARPACGGRMAVIAVIKNFRRSAKSASAAAKGNPCLQV